MSKFLSNEVGATAIEYAFIASLIALAIFASLGPITEQLNRIFGEASAGVAQR